jgi:ferrous iron transport protein B
MDEAKRRGVVVDDRVLARQLGVPVVPTAARQREGIPQLIQTIDRVATGQLACRPRRMGGQSGRLKESVGQLAARLEQVFSGLPNAPWVALRLLDGDQTIARAVRSGELGQLERTELRQRPRNGAAGVVDRVQPPAAAQEILELTSSLRWQVGADFHQSIMEEIYGQAGRIADRAVTRDNKPARIDVDRAVDRLVTSRWLGFPIMLLMLTFVFWLTVAGANVPSALLASLLIDTMHPALKSAAAAVGMPWWLDGVLIDGAYLATAWVVAVMLPPMAIFFPLFTLLEDLGYLPRVAFNLDRLFRRVGAHGKQALTMCMGFGCNAAGVIATRVIDSPRERLIAIITNNFSLCNGRWPTQILIASLFLGSLVPAYLAGLITALSVVGVALLGVGLTFLTSWLLFHTLLRGQVSTFSLELPPYRPPRVWQTIYTSIIDRTIFVLWRAIIFAVPAGAIIWLVANLEVGGTSLAQYAIHWLDPLATLFGLSGLILLAYVVAIPANEIVVPTILMLTVLTANLSGVGEGRGVMFELDSQRDTWEIFRHGGWTVLMAVNLMLFSLIHNPCSTTIYTIWKETRSLKWTLVSTFLPLAMGFGVCFFVTQIARLFGASVIAS